MNQKVHPATDHTSLSKLVHHGWNQKFFHPMSRLFLFLGPFLIYLTLIAAQHRCLPPWQLWNLGHKFLSKQFSNTDVIQPYGPHKRRVYLCLPYVGELATNKFARQIRRLIAKIAPCVELRLVFRAAQKLSCLTRLKSKFNVLSRSGVVYQISCTQCEAFYVGKTKRRLEQRVQEHSQQGYSSLYKHSSDLCHQIDYSNPAVISVDNNDYRLQIKEALKIKDLKAYNSLNANIRSCELKLW